MPEERVPLELAKASTPPLVFVSHDSRDATLAEAFSNLLKCVSAGMLKSFRSSDKSGSEGIEFGDEWYKTLMTKLNTASDVVCLITERSVNRPWILYEAGVAKGKLDTPVHGLALGVPLSRAGVGPFYQFQNSDDSEDSLTKLVTQLCKRIPGLEPDDQVVKAQVSVFRTRTAEVLKTVAGDHKGGEKKQALDEGAAAKVLEEMKLVVRELPLLIDQRLSDANGKSTPRKIRRVHPEMFFELSARLDSPEHDGLALLVLCGVMKDDFPWIYELGLDAYRALKNGNLPRRQQALEELIEVTRMTFRGPIGEIMGIGRDAFMAYRDLPLILEEYAHRVASNSGRRRPRSNTLEDVKASTLPIGVDS